MRLAPAVADCRAALRRSLAELRSGDLVLAACSGGTDSVALTAAQMWEAPRAGLRAGVLTVDHRVQDCSAERAAAVAGWAVGLGAEPVEVLTVTVGAAGGPEAAARTARYGALEDAASRLGAAAVLLGHTLDDQAETVLLGLGRGSGARSLAGMAEVAGRYRRPFLGLPRTTTAAACAVQRLPVWDDPHNADPAYTRVRVRTDALPALERSVGPGAAAALARTARLLREDADALDGWADRAALEATGPDGSLALAPLFRLPSAVRRRVLLAAVRAAGSAAGAVSAEHIAGVDAVLTGGRREVSLPGNLTAVRRHGRLYVERSSYRPDP